MSDFLSADQVAKYNRDGYLFPFDVLSAEEVADARGRLERFEAANGGPLPREMRHRPHLFSATLDRILRSPRIGISAAQHRLLRFHLAENRFVSGRRKLARRSP